MQEEIGASIILVGHDMGLMAQVVDRLGVMYAGTLAEVCAVDAMFEEPLHPYSQLLIASLPTLDQQGRPCRASRACRRRCSTRRRGCPFQPRCPQAMERCATVEPPTAGGPPGALGRLPLYDAAAPESPASVAGMSRWRCSRRATSASLSAAACCTRHRTVALEDFSLAIAGEPPSITAVVGESGSGKTTLARLLLGMTAPSERRSALRGQGSSQPHRRRAAAHSAATCR